MTQKIFFNGRVYSSEAEMPSSVREAYNRVNKFFIDDNQDGIPDFIQQGGLSGLKGVFTFVKDLSKSVQDGQSINPDQYTIIRKTGTTININGRKYNSIDEMPSEIRQAYNRIVSQVDPSEIAIYDEPWREVDRDEYFKPHDDERMFPQKHAVSSPVVEEVTSNLNFIILVAAFVILCIGAAIWIALSGSIPGI